MRSKWNPRRDPELLDRFAEGPLEYEVRMMLQQFGWLEPRWTEVEAQRSLGIDTDLGADGQALLRSALLCGVARPRSHVQQRRSEMVLATAKIEDFDRFWNTFSTKGAEKRKQHGCKGSHVFRDPNESDRVWAIFDWDEAGWQSFTSDPEVPAIFQEAGFTQGPPKSAEFLREHDA